MQNSVQDIKSRGYIFVFRFIKKRNLVCFTIAFTISLEVVKTVWKYDESYFINLVIQIN